MEKKILAAGILVLALGTVLFVMGNTTAGILILAVGAADALAVIFWPQLTNTPSERKDYSPGNQTVDALLIASGVVLTAITGMFVFLALTVGGLAALIYRYRQGVSLA